MAEPFILIPTGPTSEPIALEKPEDFVKFWQEWHNQWSWVRQGNWTTAVQAYASFIDQINSALAQTGNFRTNPQGHENAKRIINGQLNLWKQPAPAVLCPSDPRSGLVLKLKETQGNEAAIACLSVFIGSNVNLAATGQIKAKFLGGFWEAFLYDRGITDPTPYQASILTDFTKNQTDIFSKLKASFDATNVSFQERLDQATKQAAESRESAERQISDFNKALDASKKRMKDFEDTYNTKLALLAPVTYWRKKAKTHLWLSIVFGAASLLMGVAIGLYVVSEIQQLLNVGPGQKPETWRIAVILVVGGLFIYLLRIVVKLFLSQFHLQADASQRAFMVETYLSLEREGKLANSDDKKLILEALFRPVGAGLVQDDQAAVSLIEGLISRLK